MSIQTLRKSLGSMLVCGCDGTEVLENFLRLLEEDVLGGVILFARNYVNRAQLRNFTTQIRSYAKTPVFIAVDQEGGRVVRFGADFPTYPSPLYFGERNDPEGLLHATRQTAESLRECGVNLNLLPVCDLAPPDPSHVIHSRSFSAGPTILADSVKKQIELLRREKIFSCAKHFPGLVTAYGDPHLVVSRSEQSLEDFHARDYLPFRAAVESKVDMIMVTHMMAPAIDPDRIATFSEMTIGRELRGYLGFDGLVITDDLLMLGALQGILGAEAGIKAILAGCDLLIYGNVTNEVEQIIEDITSAANVNDRLRNRIEESARKITLFKESHSHYFPS